MSYAPSERKLVMLPAQEVYLLLGTLLKCRSWLAVSLQTTNFG